MTEPITDDEWKVVEARAKDEPAESHIGLLGDELSHLSNSIGEMRVALSRLEELIHLKGEVEK